MLETFHNIKMLILSTTGISRDTLYIHAGLVVFFVALACLRARLGDKSVWLVALAASVTAVILDCMYADQIGARISYWQCFDDVINAMIWPTVLTLCARLNFFKS